jgi:hypothetical protein
VGKVGHQQCGAVFTVADSPAQPGFLSSYELEQPFQPFALRLGFLSRVLRAVDTTRLLQGRRLRWMRDRLPPELCSDSSIREGRDILEHLGDLRENFRVIRIGRLYEFRGLRFADFGRHLLHYVSRRFPPARLINGRRPLSSAYGELRTFGDFWPPLFHYVSRRFPPARLINGRRPLSSAYGALRTFGDFSPPLPHYVSRRFPAARLIDGRRLLSSAFGALWTL